MKNDSATIRLRIAFTSDPNFIALMSRTGDETPILLGRLLGLVMLVDATQKTRWRVADIDRAAAWWPTIVFKPFAELLAGVGWAVRSGEDLLTFELKLPIQATNRFRTSGIRRASTAARDPRTGRYLRTPGRAPDPTPRAQVSVDAEGNEVRNAK